MNTSRTKVIKKTRAKKVAPVSLELPVVTADGTGARTFALPAELFAAPWNPSLVHQVVVSMEANARTSVAHAKGRGEVRGGGRKPWKQKGTGRARHGSSRSPIWVGGGVAHGPKSERDYSAKINKKMKRRALASVLSAKLGDGEVVLAEFPAFPAPSSKHAKTVLTSVATNAKAPMLALRKKNAALVIVGGRNIALERSLRNFGNVRVVEARNMNAPLALSYRYLLFVHPEDSVPALPK